MVNHPNRSNIRYFKVCPRGFSNEVTYFKIRNDDEAAQAEKEYGRLADEGNGGFAEFTNDAKARWFGVAVDWADRNRL